MRLTQYLRAVAARARGERASLSSIMDTALQETGEQLAQEFGETPEWITYAAPLIERFEGMARLIPGDKVEAYPDPATGGAPWTIGIGSTTDELGKPIEPGAVWTVERARKRFETHLREFGADVAKLVAGKPTNPRQFAALVSFAYNLGSDIDDDTIPEGLGDSTLLKKHLRGDYQGAADEFLKWDKAKGRVLRGLTRRRKAERELYLS